jgi:hypothetical protein
MSLRYVTETVAGSTDHLAGLGGVVQVVIAVYRGGFWDHSSLSICIAFIIQVDPLEMRLLIVNAPGC